MAGVVDVPAMTAAVICAVMRPVVSVQGGRLVRARLVSRMGAVIVMPGLFLMVTVCRMSCLLFAQKALAVVMFPVLLSVTITCVPRMFVVHRMQSPMLSRLHLYPMLPDDTDRHMRHMTHLCVY
jgi:hypothetical protein